MTLNPILMCKMLDNGQILTPKCRLSWLAIDKPRAMMGDESKMRFQATLLFDTTEVDLTPLFDAAEKLAIETFGKDYLKIKDFHLPIKDGSIEEKAQLDGYGAGVWYIDTKSLYAPKLLARDRSIADASIFYAGCYARCLGSLYAYKPTAKLKASKTGIAFGFNALQFVNDGEPFGGGAVNPDDFDPVD